MRQILSCMLALLLALGVAFVSRADVTGSLDINLALNPEGTQTEAVKFNIDLQSNLQLTVTLSGLTFGADLGFGTTGIEFAILSLNTQLGALSVFDEFVFAQPFGANFTGVCGSTTDATPDQCPGDQVFPIGSSTGDADEIDSAVGFVKKRISLEINIAGVTLRNLAIFEDVDFPDIHDGIDGVTHEFDHFGPGSFYHVGGVNNTIDDQTPTYGFGDVITLSGQTVSGITVTGSTTLCASANNFIKKRNWRYEVNKACTAGFGGSLATPVEGGAKTPLLFEEETLRLEGVELGGVTIDIETIFRPLQPLTTTISASFAVLDLATLTFDLASDNLTALSIDRLDVTIVSGNLFVLLRDNDGNLNFDLSLASFSTVLNPNQNPADLGITLISVNGVGVVELDVELGISRGALSFDAATVFAGNGTLAWTQTTFSFSVAGDPLTLSANFTYTPSGMGQTHLTVGVTF